MKGFIFINKQNVFFYIIPFVVVSIITISTPAWGNEEEPLAIKVMTLNLHNGRDLKGEDNLAAFLRLLEEEKPDLVALQEVEARHLPALQATGWQVVPGFNANRLNFRFGNVIMTPHRLVHQRHHYLPGELEQRGINEVAVEIGGQYFQIINTHLGLGRGERESQFNEILRITSFLDGPFLIVGDFNTGPHDQVFTKLLAGFAEVGNLMNLPNTYPTVNPKYRIDLIWFSEDWRLQSAQVLPWEHSDHLPVIASVQLKVPWRKKPEYRDIPDFNLQFNPLLPDVGRKRAGAEFSFVVSQEEVTGSKTRLFLPLGPTVTLRGEIPLKPVSTDLPRTAEFILAYSFKEIDLRDYFSLYGLRGKAEFSLFLTAVPQKRYGWGIEQYYRWSNCFGTRLLTTISKEEFFWSVEGIYLPSDRLSLKTVLDHQGELITGLSYAINKNMLIEGHYALQEKQVGVGVGFYL